MDKYDVILRPLITEQGTHLAASQNAYSFKVNPKANKIQIKSAIEQIYSVKVADVRTMNRKGKPKRHGYKQAHTSAWKKAVVVLQQDQVIDLF